MPTDSITKRFVIKDDAICKKLVDDLETVPVRKQVQKSGPSSYEKGKELLAKCYCR